MTDEAKAQDWEQRVNGLMGLANKRLSERDAAMAEVERLRAELATYTQTDPDDIYAAPTAPQPPSTEAPESGEPNDEQQVEVRVVSDPIYTAMQRQSSLVDSDGRMMVPASVARKFSADQSPADPVEQARANFERDLADYTALLREQG